MVGKTVSGAASDREGRVECRYWEHSWLHGGESSAFVSVLCVLRKISEPSA